MHTSDTDLEERRWWFLRFAPRHDSGVLYHSDAPSEVWAQSMVDVVPLLVSTSDFAPADMQYRMHRALLWNPETGLYGERFNVDHDAWVNAEPSALTNAAVAEAMAGALRMGGDGTPAEMRNRWQRETRALIEVLSALELNSGSAELLMRAVNVGTEDGWLEA